MARFLAKTHIFCSKLQWIIITFMNQWNSSRPCSEMTVVVKLRGIYVQIQSLIFKQLISLNFDRMNHFLFRDPYFQETLSLCVNFSNFTVTSQDSA